MESTYFLDACGFEGNLIVGGVVRDRDLMYDRYLDGIIVHLSHKFDVIWSWKYGGTLRDVIKKVACDKKGNIFTVGYTESWNAIRTNLWIMKLNPEGHVVWGKHLGGRASDKAHDLAVCPNGDLIIAGITSSFGNMVPWILRISSEGEILWQKTYHPDLYHQSRSIEGISLAIVDRKIYVVRTINIPRLGTKVWVLKLSGEGEVESSYVYDLKDFKRKNVQSSFVLPTPDGGILIGGETDAISSNSKSFVMKLNGDDELLWAKGIGSGYPRKDILYGGTMKGNSAILYGETSSYGKNSSSGWILNLDSDGAITNELIIDVGYSDDVMSVLSRNGVLAVGNTFSISMADFIPSLPSVNWGMVTEITEDHLKNSPKKSHEIPLTFVQSTLDVHVDVPPMVPSSPHYLDKLVLVNEHSKKGAKVGIFFGGNRSYRRKGKQVMKNKAKITHFKTGLNL